jgi:RNA polymerase sigma-70 factor (ECF subfamily)
MGRRPNQQLDETWRAQRPFAIDLAYRMMGNISDAEDVAQEAFMRLLSVDIETIDDVRGWLAVVVSRLCLDQLRSARVKRTDRTPIDREQGAPAGTAVDPADPADRTTLDDELRLALAVVLEHLSPAERSVFILHDVFQFPFETAASILGRTPAACRQLASRARRRLDSEVGAGRFVVEEADQRMVTERFIAACAGGDVDALMEVLDAEVTGDADLGPDYPTPPILSGRDLVARRLLGFFGPATGTTLVSQPVRGQPGVLAFRSGRLAGMVWFSIVDGMITRLHAVADPVRMTAR